MKTPKTIDQEKLMNAAKVLKAALDRYAPVDSDAAKLRGALFPIVDRATRGLIREPLKWVQVPGAYPFNETGLRQYGDLEEAYAAFKLQVTAFDQSPFVRELRETLDQGKRSMS